MQNLYLKLCAYKSVFLERVLWGEDEILREVENDLLTT